MEWPDLLRQYKNPNGLKPTLEAIAADGALPENTAISTLRRRKDIKEIWDSLDEITILPENTAAEPGLPRVDFDSLFQRSDEFLIEQALQQQNQILDRCTAKRWKPEYKVAVLSDHQIPFQDDVAIGLTYEILKDWKPDIIYYLGDVIDNHAISRWTTDPTRKNYLLEREIARNYLNIMKDLHPSARHIWHMGNHELRLQSLILKKADSLADLLQDELSFEAIYDCDRLGFKIVNKITKIGKLNFLHGHENFARGQVVHVALRNLRWLNQSSICGHWHVMQQHSQRQLDASWISAFVNPCLFNPHKMPGGGYTAIDTCQRGISLISFDAQGNFFVNQIPFIEQIIKGEWGYFAPYDGDFIRYSVRPDAAKA